MSECKKCGDDSQNFLFCSEFCEMDYHRIKNRELEAQLQASQDEVSRLKGFYSKSNMLRAFMEILYIKESFCSSQRVHGVLARVLEQLTNNQASETKGEG